MSGKKKATNNNPLEDLTDLGEDLPSINTQGQSHRIPPSGLTTSELPASGLIGPTSLDDGPHETTFRPQRYRRLEHSRCTFQIREDSGFPNLPVIDRDPTVPPELPLFPETWINPSYRVKPTMRMIEEFINPLAIAHPSNSPIPDAFMDTVPFRDDFIRNMIDPDLLYLLGEPQGSNLSYTRKGHIGGSVMFAFQFMARTGICTIRNLLEYFDAIPEELDPLIKDQLLELGPQFCHRHTQQLAQLLLLRMYLKQSRRQSVYLEEYTATMASHKLPNARATLLRYKDKLKREAIIHAGRALACEDTRYPEHWCTVYEFTSSAHYARWVSGKGKVYPLGGNIRLDDLQSLPSTMSLPTPDSIPKTTDGTQPQLRPIPTWPAAISYSVERLESPDLSRPSDTQQTQGILQPTIPRFDGGESSYEGSDMQPESGSTECPDELFDSDGERIPIGICDNCGKRGPAGYPCTRCEDSGMLYLD